MKRSRYLAYNDSSTLYNGLNVCSRASDESPLMINCAGFFSTDSVFTTYNHYGRQDYYFIYLVKGTLDLFCPDGSITRLCGGDATVFPPEYKYKYRHSESDELEYAYVHYTGSYAKKLLSDLGIGTFPTVLNTGLDDTVVLRLNRLYDAFDDGGKFKENEISLLFQNLLLTIGKKISADCDSSAIRRSISYINSNYSSEIRVGDLAKMESLSTSRYNDVFKREIGCSPIEYVSTVRIHAACDLLSSTDLSVYEISLMSGYKDPHFFSRSFKARIGVSPLTYRKNGNSTKGGI